MTTNDTLRAVYRAPSAGRDYFTARAAAHNEAAAILEDRKWSKIVWPAGHERAEDPARCYLERLWGDVTRHVEILERDILARSKE